MKLIVLAVLGSLGQACGSVAPLDARLQSGQTAAEQAFCKPVEGLEICIPHIGRGERVFGLVARGTSAPQGGKLITTGLSEAEQDVRSRRPESDLYDLSARLPEVVRKNFNHLKNFSGPNCYATALMASGVLPEEGLLYVGLEEMELYLSRYFAEVAKPQAGDVILYDVNGSKDHVAYYLFDDLVFHKKGYRKGYGFRMTELTKVFAADPFEWRPSPFADEQPKDDPTFGERPKKYFRRLAENAVSTSPTPSGKEAAAMAVIALIHQQTKISAPNWSVAKDMGTMIESAIGELLREFQFLKSSPSFEAQLAYEKLHSLESQAFQSIEETLYTSDRADPEKINEEHCLMENEFLNAFLKKFYAYRHQVEPTPEQLAKMLADVRKLDRRSCRFALGADW